MTDLGFAALYREEARPSAAALEDVKGTDWRNILVLGRATKDGVYPETLALVGRARYMADELGCRVEVLLIGSNLDKATEQLRRFPIDTVYRVKAPDYAPIDHTSRILEAVVRKRRPELVLVFQSRTGDAVTAYAASRLGVGFAAGASRIDIDTNARRAVVTHESGGRRRFQVVTAMQSLPQFVSVQQGLFRAPLEDPSASVRVHDLEVDAGRLADIKVEGHRPPLPATLKSAQRVVVAGARIQDAEELELVRKLAQRLDAVFGVTVGIVERGFAKTHDIVGVGYHTIAPRLLVTVGVRGALDFLQAIEGDPTVCAVGCDESDPIAKRAAYMVAGDVRTAVESLLEAL
jgi:electron transfer flavoprotein alpha subunit